MKTREMTMAAEGTGCGINQSVSDPVHREAYVTPMGDRANFEITMLQSIQRADVAELGNDPAHWNICAGWAEFLNKLASDGQIDSAKVFSDQKVDGYRDINKVPLPGLRWDGTKQKYLRVSDATVAEKRAYMERVMIPGAARKMLMTLDRATPTVRVREEMKPATVEALREFYATFDDTKGISDEEILRYRNVNEEPLPGLRWDGSKQKYVQIAAADATVPEQREYLRYATFSDMSPRIVEEMKPATVAALKEIMDSGALKSIVESIEAQRQ